MKEFTLNKLWDLRAELNSAIINKDYEHIKVIKVKYRNLVEGERDFSRAFICYNHGFWSTSERRSHNFLNVNAILHNIECYEKKYLDGDKNVSVKLKTQYTTGFLAQEIWILRAMYDKFLLNSDKLEELQTQQNMILGKAIIDRLVTLIHMEQTEAYYDQLLPILKEVREGYDIFYGNNQPRISYSQISKEFLQG